MASISLVMVVPSNFCNQDFVIDHRFSMRLGSGKFPSQSNTVIHFSENSFHYFRWITRGKTLLEFSSTIRKSASHIQN